MKDTLLRLFSILITCVDVAYRRAKIGERIVSEQLMVETHDYYKILGRYLTIRIYIISGIYRNRLWCFNFTEVTPQLVCIGMISLIELH